MARRRISAWLAAAAAVVALALATPAAQAADGYFRFPTLAGDQAVFAARSPGPASMPVRAT